MKKLLLTLGTVAAVAAPVAAVVACGTGDKTVALKSTTSEIKIALSKVGYSMKDSEISKLSNWLVSKAGDKKVNFVSAHEGMKTDPRHGKGSFMVVMNGGTEKDFTNQEGFSTERIASFNAGDGVTAPEVPSGVLSHDKWSIGTPLDKNGALRTNWEGYTSGEINSDDFVIFFQNDGKGAVTIQASMVVKFGDEHYLLATLADEMGTHGYTLLDLIGTVAKPTAPVKTA